MGDVLLPATSGRAKCRACGRGISTGELRFGESLPNAYAEGEALYWFHPLCAACTRPEKFLPVLEASDAVIADRDWMKAAAEFGIAHHRVPRLAHAERSKSGKARCRSCREIIEGGVMRLALSMFEEGRMSPMGFIHAECALNYFGTIDLLDRIEKLSPGIDQAALTELSERFRNPRPPQPEAEEQTPDEEGPDVAKARPSGPSEPKQAGNSGQ